MHSTEIIYSVLSENLLWNYAVFSQQLLKGYILTPIVISQQYKKTS
jgi:hypothetical protein